MKRKNKLPRYWLGTRMPTSLGYQPNYGIGGQLMSSTPGLSLYPEILATRLNAIPGAINKFLTGSSFALEALKNTVPTNILTKTSEKALGKYLYDSFNEAVNTGNITSTAPNISYTRALGTLGKVAAGVGTAYGAADMGMQIAANKDHRTAGQMRDTLTTNTYTTDFGNLYTTRGGVDLGNELKYARALRTNRNLNFTLSSIGTGMSAGALIGSAAPGIGTAVGAGVGALIGGLSYLAGFGDTEEETREAANTLTDSITMEGRMAESMAKTKDAQQGFYGGIKSGKVGAANGKRPIHARNGYGNAMVSHGEVIGNLNEGWAYREPGIPDNNDTLKRHIAKDDFVISNKYGLSDYAASTGDLVGALLLLDMLMKYNNGKGYKCGKLPKFEGGYWDRAFMAMPNIALMLAATQLYNKDINRPAEAPLVTPNYSSARNLAYAILGDMIPSRPYMNMIDDEVARNKYAISRMPGMGMGGRAVLMDSADKMGLNEKTKQRLNIDERNRASIETARKLLANTNAHAEDMRIQTATDLLNRYARAVGAKDVKDTYNWLNIFASLPHLVKDQMDYSQFERAQALQEKLLGIIEKKANIEELWLNNWLNGNNTPTVATPSTKAAVSVGTSPYIAPRLNTSFPRMFSNSLYQPSLQYNIPSSLTRYSTPSYIPWYGTYQPFTFNTNFK